MNSIRLGIALFLVLPFIFVMGCAKSPESTVESFYRALSKGEITEATGYVSAQIVDMLGESKLSASLTAEAEKIGKCGGIKSINVKLQGKGEIRDGEASVTYTGDCRPKTEKVKLVKENGKWKLTADK